MSTSYAARQEAKRWAAEHSSPTETTEDAQTDPAAQRQMSTKGSTREKNKKTLDPAELPFLSLRTVAEAAVLLRVPETWLRRKVSRREIPFTRVGHYVRFSAEDIQTIVRDGARPPLPATAERASRRHSLSQRQ
jgi:excisionase family DNA binding protein